MNKPFTDTYEKPTFYSALRATWPVMVGYLPMAIAFGWLYGNVFLSFLSGAWVYAGAAQFLSVKLFQSQTSLFEIFMSVFFLNLRHVFYSLHFLTRYERFSFWIKMYSVISLTDETYAILTNHRGQSPEDDSRLVWRISFLNHVTWAIGCLLGAVLNSLITIKIKGLDFFLVGLFVVLLVEKLKKDRKWIPLGIAASAGILCFALGSSLWLFWAMGLCAFFGLFVFSSEAKQT